jgi:hypothetical protein
LLPLPILPLQLLSFPPASFPSLSRAFASSHQILFV